MIAWLTEKMHTVEGAITAVLAFCGSLIGFWKFVFPRMKKGYTVGFTMMNIVEVLGKMEKKMDSGFNRLEEGMLHNIGIRHAMANAEDDRAFFHADPRGKIVWMSKAWERWTGSSTHSARGNGWELSVPEDIRARVVSDWQLAIDHERSYEARYSLLHQFTRERVEVLATAEPLRNKDGKILDFLGVIKHIGSAPTRPSSIGASNPKTP